LPADVERVSPPSSGTTALFSNARDLQIADSTFTLTARDSYNIVHNHNVHDQSKSLKEMLRAILKLVPNFRRIYQDMLSKATAGTGLWLLDSNTFRLWLEPNGDIKIFWGSGMRTLLFQFPLGSLLTSR
jgi:hypothetical protein